MKKFFTRTLWVVLTLGLFLPDANAVIVPVKPATENPDPATVAAAVNSLKDLSSKEKRAKLKEVKKAVKEYKAARKNSEPITDNTLLLVLITILLPPLGVYLHQGEINTKFWISLVLTLLFYIPGLVYSLIVVLGADKKG
jgi:uncharacterized membrane protein YqaE (UPF0057 family)